MPRHTMGRSKNWKFSYAAAAMGEFWERARKLEAQRIERLRRAVLQRAARVVAATAPLSRPAGAPLG